MTLDIPWEPPPSSHDTPSACTMGLIPALMCLCFEHHSTCLNPAKSEPAIVSGSFLLYCSGMSGDSMQPTWREPHAIRDSIKHSFIVGTRTCHRSNIGPKSSCSLLCSRKFQEEEQLSALKSKIWISHSIRTDDFLHLNESRDILPNAHIPVNFAVS